MRKDSCRADARLLFFEKELLYSKLTVASGIRKGLLLVSFVAVRSRCHCALKNAFLYRLALHELKKSSFPRIKKISISRKLYGLHSKPFFTYKNFICTSLFSLSAKTSIFTNQKFFFCRKLYELSSKTAFYVQKIFYSHKLSLFPPKITLFCPQPPIRTTLNLLSTKEYSCSFNLCSKSLRCKAGTSHRFKSLPAIPGEVAAFRKTGYRMIAGHFRNNHVSTGDLNRPRSPEVRKPLVYFWFFSYTRKE